MPHEVYVKLPIITYGRLHLLMTLANCALIEWLIAAVSQSLTQTHTSAGFCALSLQGGPSEL